MRLGVVMLLLGLSGCAPAVTVGVLAADAATTIAVLDRGGIERNPLLGPYPSPGEVIVWTGVGMVAVFGVAELLPQTWRTPWFWSVAAIDLVFVLHNVRVLIRGW